MARPTPTRLATHALTMTSPATRRLSSSMVAMRAVFSASAGASAAQAMARNSRRRRAPPDQDGQLPRGEHPRHRGRPRARRRRRRRRGDGSVPWVRASRSRRRQGALDAVEERDPRRRRRPGRRCTSPPSRERARGWHTARSQRRARRLPGSPSRALIELRRAVGGDDHDAADAGEGGAWAGWRRAVGGRPRPRPTRGRTSPSTWRAGRRTTWDR